VAFSIKHHQLLVAVDDVIAVSRSRRQNDDSRTKEENCRTTFDQQTTEQA
jgi:hypothetical protein